MEKKDLTITDLAGMVQRGFTGVDKQFSELRYEINKRFDEIEKILLEDHQQRIDRLEDQVKELQADYRQLLGMKK